MIKNSLLILLFILISGAFAQKTLFHKSGEKTIPSIKENDVEFVSLDGFIKEFNAASSYDPKVLKKELRLENGAALFTARNPFVVIVRKDEKGQVYQMFTDLRMINKEFYVPLNEFIKIINIISSDKFSVESPAPKKPAESEEPKIKEFIPPVISFEINSYKIEDKSNGILFTINSSTPIVQRTYHLGKRAFYIELPKKAIDTTVFSELFDFGLISKIDSRQRKGNAELKISFRFDITSFEVDKTKETKELKIAFFVSPEVMKKINQQKTARKKDTSNNKSKLDVVVIDAGHGGKDAGAIGYNGTYEKKVNLAIALKTGKLIEKNMKDVKVIYTRDDDSFVELFRRGQIANENKGKLFISIHSNSTPKRPGNLSGTDVYLLRPGRTNESIKIAEYENSVIKFEEGYEERYKHLSDENFILVSMSQTANVKHSEKFAEMISNRFTQNLKIENNGIKQAGFFVLVGASMPGVLIESGYLNNPSDEKYLNSEEGQNDIASSVYQAVSEYKKYYETLTK